MSKIFKQFIILSLKYFKAIFNLKYADLKETLFQLSGRHLVLSVYCCRLMRELQDFLCYLALNDCAKFRVLTDVCCFALHEFSVLTRELV